jgi:hypothetical protein
MSAPFQRHYATARSGNAGASGMRMALDCARNIRFGVGPCRDFSSSASMLVKPRRQIHGKAQETPSPLGLAGHCPRPVATIWALARADRQGSRRAE